MTLLTKTFMVVVLIITLNINLAAQNANLQGVTLHATEFTYDLESDENYDENQIFTFSFKDKVMVHHLMDGEMVAQVYSIINVEFTRYDGFVNYQTTVKSGLSGKEYVYNVFILDSDNSVYIEFDGIFFSGRAAFVRSFRQ